MGHGRSTVLDAVLSSERVLRPLRRSVPPLRVSVIAIVLFLSGLADSSAVFAYPQVNSYYANDGSNLTQDNGELGTDVLGNIPFKLEDATLYGSGWNGLSGFTSFAAALRAHATDLSALINDVSLEGKPALLPLTLGQQVVLEPTWGTSNPKNQTAWWGGTSQPNFMQWAYRINGGLVVISKRVDINNSPNILLTNMPWHGSDYGTNLPPSSRNPAAADWYTAPIGPAPIGLGLDEQALDFGDIVVTVMENYSVGFWIALQRTQEADSWVRNDFRLNELNPALALHGLGPANLGKSIVYGGSWGAGVAIRQALLQSGIYAACGAVDLTDLPYWVKSYDPLRSFHQGALGNSTITSVFTGQAITDTFLAVDILGCRFDHPDLNVQPWDIGAFSPAARPGDLAIPMKSYLLDEDITYNFHWAHSMIGGNYQPQTRKNHDHGGIYDFVQGHEEYMFDESTAWSQLSANLSNSPNVEIVPSGPPPLNIPIYPDPYQHTLRHPTHTNSIGVPSFLSQMDLSNAGQPISSNPNQVWTLGQGVWIGYGDTMRVGDIDNDNNIEVVFPNLDGYVHVMELDQSGNDIKLRDEWRSPYLGPMCCAFAGFGSPSNGAYMYVGDATGTVHRIQITGGNSYSMMTPLVPRPSPPYDGPIRQIIVGDFVGGGAREIAVQNWQNDWNFYDTSGNLLPNKTLLRSTHAIQPGMAEAANGDAFHPNAELWIPALDGYLWRYDAAATPPTLANAFSIPNHVLHRVVPVYFGGTGAAPTHYLLLARNSDLALSGQSPDVVVLVKASDGTSTEISASAGSEYEAPVSFTWMVKPESGNPVAKFAVGSRHQVEVFQLVHDLSLGTYTLGSTGIRRSFAAPAVEASLRVAAEFGGGDADVITSVKSASANGGPQILFVAFADGRIMPLDFNLNAMRKSDKEYAGDLDVPGGFVPTDWYANRTFGHQMPTDLWQDSGIVSVTPADGVHFAECCLPIAMKNQNTSVYRHGRLSIGPTGNPSWDPYIGEAASYDRNDPVQAKLEPYAAEFRVLRVGDFDQNHVVEPHVFAEAGDLYVDSAFVVREFCTQGVYPPAMRSIDVAAGGYLFECDPSHTLRWEQWMHVGFGIPNDPTINYASFPNGNNWFYPIVGANGAKHDGQIAAHASHAVPYQFGSSVRIASLSDGQTLVPHVVVGTFGGYVYAIKPGTHTSGNTVASTLDYSSVDLGDSVIGLDAGNLDNDAGDEIVAGTWFDTGGRTDWAGSTPWQSNRAHVHILKAPTSGSPPQTFTEEAKLDGDDLCGQGLGIGSGVTGIKIDDVDHDGRNEIWAGDAVGHIYLFRRRAGTSLTWDCIFRSEDLGAYVGRYNGIYPIKNLTSHKTVRLVVMTAGYVYGFEVHPDQLGPPP